MIGNSANQLTNDSSVAASSANTASVAPAANRLILVTVASKINASNPNEPSLSGLGLTWTLVRSKLYAPTQSLRLSVFRALSTSTPTPGALSITFAGQTQDRINWSIVEFIAVDTGGSNGANAVVQSGEVTQDTTSTGVTLTLSAFADQNNGVFAALYTLATNTITPGSGFTELTEQNDGECVLETEWRRDNDTSVDWSWASASFPVVGIALELKSGQTFQGGMI